MTSIPTHVFFRVLRSFVVTTALAGTPVCAQDITSEIDKIFQWATPTTPGCVCAVSQHGKVIVNRAYGSADLERDVLLSPQSILDAGSVVKQFVAASVLLLVEDGQLSLTEDIRTYIPELPDTGHTITLDHLLTHTSGVRDWTGMRPLATGDPDALTLTLRQRGLNFAPGEEWSYSNSGYEGDRRARERNVLLRLHAAASVRPAADDVDHIPARYDGRGQAPRACVQEGGRAMEA